MVAVLRAEPSQFIQSPSSHSPSSHTHLKIYREGTRTPIPPGYQAKISDKLEDLNFQVLKTPVRIVSNSGKDQGIYLVEFNLDHLDFSKLNQNALEGLKKEIRVLEEQKDVKHLIISFYDCRSLEHLKNLEIKDNPEFSESSWTINAGDYFVDLLIEARTHSRLNDKRLSIIHNEPKLHTYSSLTDYPGFIHGNLKDAIQFDPQRTLTNYSSNPLPRKEPEEYTKFLKHFIVSD